MQNMKMMSSSLAHRLVFLLLLPPKWNHADLLKTEDSLTTSNMLKKFISHKQKWSQSLFSQGSHLSYDPIIKRKQGISNVYSNF